MQLPDYEETMMRNKKELIRVAIDQIKKNFPETIIQCYNEKTIFPNSISFFAIYERLKLKRTVDFEDANVIVVEKNNKTILSIFPASIVKRYAFINIFNDNLNSDEQNILLKILTINNIKLPASTKKWRKIQFIVSIYSIIAFACFYLFMNTYADNIYHNMGLGPAIIIIFIVLIVVVASISVPLLVIAFKRKKAIKLEKMEIEKIEIKM